MIAGAQDSEPGKVPWFFGLDKDQPDRAFVRLVAPSARDARNSTIVTVSRETGRRMIAMPPDETIAGILLRLHSEWFLDLPGQLFGAAIAIIVLISLVTGTAIHAPFVRRLLFGTIRRGRGARIVQLDLHNLFGVVLLGWLFLVTASGVLLSVNVLLVPIWRATEMREMAGNDVRPPKFVPLDQVIAAAQVARPDRELRFVFYPGTDFSSAGHFTVGLFGQHRFDERLFDVVLVDAATGVVSGARAMPWYLKAVLVAAPLHYGNYGGLPLKLLWAASTIGALFITSNGVWLWFKRQQRQSPRKSA